MPTYHFRTMRLLAMSGLLMLATFTYAKAQEPPVNPNITDIELPPPVPAELKPASPLAVPEIDYPDCGPVPGAWHPPVFYPNPTLGCPTGVVHRDWWREKTLCHHIRHRQRMLEKDDLWRAQNAGQPTCCPPPSCWGHSSDCCPGIGSRSRCFGLSWFGFGGKCNSCGEACGRSCGETPCSQGPACGTHNGSVSDGDQTSALEPAAPALLPVSDAVALLPVEQPEQIQPEAGEAAEDIVLVGHEQSAGAAGVGVESAGYCTVSDSCPQGACPSYVSGGWGGCVLLPLDVPLAFLPGLVQEARIGILLRRRLLRGLRRGPL